MDLSSLLNYLKADPLRLLYLLGGSGGAVYWYDRYRNRPRLRVNHLTDDLVSTNSPPKVTFEVENIGTSPSSLNRAIRMTAYKVLPTLRGKRIPFRLQKVAMVFEVASEDRGLPPLTPTVLSATAARTGSLPPLWFKTYRVVPTKGRTCRVRIRNALGKRLWIGRFYYEMIVLRLTRVPLREQPPSYDFRG